MIMLTEAAEGKGGASKRKMLAIIGLFLVAFFFSPSLGRKWAADILTVSSSNSDFNGYHSYSVFPSLFTPIFHHHRYKRQKLLRTECEFNPDVTPYASFTIRD